MHNYQIIEKDIGEDFFYCVTFDSRPVALFKDHEEARTYVAIQLANSKKVNIPTVDLQFANLISTLSPAERK